MPISENIFSKSSKNFDKVVGLWTFQKNRHTEKKLPVFLNNVFFKKLNFSKFRTFLLKYFYIIKEQKIAKNWELCLKKMFFSTKKAYSNLFWHKFLMLNLIFEIWPHTTYMIKIAVFRVSKTVPMRDHFWTFWKIFWNQDFHFVRAKFSMLDFNQQPEIQS